MNLKTLGNQFEMQQWIQTTIKEMFLSSSRRKLIRCNATICRSQVSPSPYPIVNTLEADILNLQKKNQDQDEEIVKLNDKIKENSKKITNDARDLDDISGRIYKLEEKVNLIASQEHTQQLQQLSMTPEPVAVEPNSPMKPPAEPEQTAGRRSRPDSQVLPSPRMVSSPSISGQEFYKLKNKMAEFEKKLDALDFSRDSTMNQSNVNIDFATVYKELETVKNSMTRQMERLTERVEILEPQTSGHVEIIEGIEKSLINREEFEEEQKERFTALESELEALKKSLNVTKDIIDKDQDMITGNKKNIAEIMT